MNKIKIFYSALFVIISILFVLSSTNFILKEEEVQVYDVTLLIDDIDSQHLGSFESGLDAAAKEYNIDVSKRTLLNLDDIHIQQYNQILEEENLPSDGVIVLSKNESVLQELLASTRTTKPIVYSTMALQQSDSDHIFYDYESAGEELANFIKSSDIAYNRVYFVYDTLDEHIQLCMDGFTKEIDIEQHMGITLETEEVLDFMNTVTSNDVIVSFSDKGITSFLQEDVYLYSVSSSPLAIEALLDNEIHALLCFDEYLAGYKSIEHMIKKIEGERIKEQSIISYEIITADNFQMYESFLIPIE